MSTTGILLVALALAALGIVAVVTVQLVRSSIRLARSAMAFFADISPALDEITREADRAAQRAATLQNATAREGRDG